MGSNTSKINETVAQTQKDDLDVGDNPDPRSPTPEITRTPLQGKTGAKHNITKNVDLRKTFENGETKEKLIHNNPILSAVIKNHLQSYDPRSPTQDFDRTPIILTSNVEENNIQRVQTNNYCASPSLQDDDSTNKCETAIDANNLCHDVVVPKNLCQGFYDMTLDDTLKDSDEPLGSSTASNEAIESNISDGCVIKPTKLLETDFNYHENDIDEFGSTEDIGIADRVKTGCAVKNVALFKVLNEDPRSPSIGIERTPIVVAKLEEESSPENVEEMSDDTLIKVLQNTNIELRQTCNSLEKNTEELLVYEDETTSLNDTPKKSKSATNSNNRTPLSCMKNKDAENNRSKSANTLYDPKKQNVVPNKMTKRTSHIPRLKSLSRQSKLLQTGSSISLKNVTKPLTVIGDCENTPPNSHRDRWDKDSSIVL